MRYLYEIIINTLETTTHVLLLLSEHSMYKPIVVSVETRVRSF